MLNGGEQKMFNCLKKTNTEEFTNFKKIKNIVGSADSETKLYVIETLIREIISRRNYDDVENYKRLKEQMDQGTTINPDKVRTPDAGPLPELTEAMEAYDTYFKDFMNNKVQKCANGDK
jgi:hypothetical protein